MAQIKLKKSLEFLLTVLIIIGCFLAASVSSLSARAEETQKKISKYSGRALFSMYLTENDRLYAIGNNSFGQLGDGTVSERERYQAKPVKISNVEQVETGAFHVIALDQDGAVYTWGNNRYGQLGVDNRELIDSSIGNEKYVEGRDMPLPQKVNLGEVAAKEIAAGDNFSIVLDADGCVWTFGWNRNGQLGTDGETKKSSVSAVPQKVKGVDGEEYLKDITAVRAAGTTAFALDSNGQVYAWGSNFNGLLGNPDIAKQSTVPVKVKKDDGTFLTDVKELDAHTRNAVALLRSGEVYVWGNNMYGQAGNGTCPLSTPSVEKVDVPQQVQWLEENSVSVEKVVCGMDILYALSDDGTLYGWGQCSNGSLGIGNYIEAPEYVKVKDESGKIKSRNEVVYPCALTFQKDEEKLAVKNLIGIDCGRGFVETTDGTVWSWGDNQYGMAGSTDELANIISPIQAKLEMSGKFDIVQKQKNYMITPIVVICITVVLIVVLVIWQSLRQRRWALMDYEVQKQIEEHEKNKK